MPRLVALLCLIVSAAFPAAAGVSHTVRFGQGPVVMVWQDGQLQQGREVGLSGSDSLAAPAAPVMGGGLLLPARFSEAEEAEGGGARYEMRVQVASNVAFALVGSGRVDGVSVRVDGVGVNARFPGDSPAPQMSANGTVLFRSLERTAARPGTPQTQSVTLVISSDYPLRGAGLRVVALAG